MLDQAFAALTTYDWGPKRSTLKPIDDAIAAAGNDSAAQEKLEKRLVAALEAEPSRAAINYICRKLMMIGSAASVSALARRLPEQENSHMARYALERMTCPEAAQSLRDALSSLDGELKVGVIGSLGVRQDEASVKPLKALLGDGDLQVARSSAFALGAIHTAAAGAALAEAIGSSGPVGKEVQAAASDAALACAESMLAAGKKSEARQLYQGLATGSRPKHVRLAATRGMLACAGK